MPRLRYLKNFDVSFDPSDFEEECENDDQGTGTDNTADNGQLQASTLAMADGDNEPATPTTGAGWWSNEQIIASIPDAKLHQTLLRYREMVKLLELECRVRSHVGSQEPGNIGRLRRSRSNAGRWLVNSPQAKRQKKQAKGQQKQLSSEQLLKALQLLQQIMSKKSKKE